MSDALLDTIRDELAQASPPGPGHNQPPEPTPLDRAATLVETANKWLAERGELASQDEAGRAQAFVDQLRGNAEDLEAARKAEREPYDLAIVVVQAKYREPLELVGIALEKLKGMATRWLDREKARVAREAEARRQAADEAEAEAARARAAADTRGAPVEAELVARKADETAERLRAAAQKPVERVAIRGDYSARAMSLRSNWKARVVDEKLALKHYGKDPDVRAAALVAATKLATKLAKTTKDARHAPPGFEFFNDEKAS